MEGIQKSSMTENDLETYYALFLMSPDQNHKLFEVFDFLSGQPRSPVVVYIIECHNLITV